MAKIVIDARRIHSTTGRYYRSVIESLQLLNDEDNEYHIIIHDKDQGTWSPKAKNFFLHVVPYDHYSFGEQIGFARFLYKLKPDLVHFCMPQQPLLYFGKRITNVYDLTLVRFKNLDKNRLIYWIEQSIFKFLLKNVSRRSKVVIVDSHFVKDDLIKFAKIPPEKVVVAYGAASASVAKKVEPIKQLEGKDFILYVGNAFPHKNLQMLADAHADLLHKQPGLRLVFAGKKDFFHNRLEDYTAAQKYSHVLHLGFVSDEQLAWLYKHAKAYVFPSLSEGFGLPGLEVMQHDTPLVSSNATSLPEVYGDAAHYFDPTKKADIVRAVDEVLRSEHRRQELIKHGRERLKRYSWTKTAKITHRQYLNVLK